MTRTGSTSRFRVLRLRGDTFTARPDFTATEEPVEIRVNSRALTVTMRTPGADFELTAGFLVGEGIIGAYEDIAAIRHCPGSRTGDETSYNIVDVTLAPGIAEPDALAQRNFYTTSSCGLCGKASLDAVRTTRRWPIARDTPSLSPELIATFPDRLRTAQRVFQRTGGLHAAGLFDEHGQARWVREDVGRHNAVDKVIGRMLWDGGVPAAESALLVSGRASFELTQKAAMAGIPMLAAVSAPSSLAVELARELDMTLVGFLRGESMNVYAGGRRLGLADPVPSGVSGPD